MTWIVRHQKYHSAKTGPYYITWRSYYPWNYLHNNCTVHSIAMLEGSKAYYDSEAEARAMIEEYKLKYFSQTERKRDIPVFTKESGIYNESIIYDPQQREYYNTRTDLFLTDDDITYHRLRPYSLITSPLPTHLPRDYFTNWKDDTPSDPDPFGE